MTNRTEGIPEHLAATLTKRGLSHQHQVDVLGASLLSIPRLKGIIRALDMVSVVPGDTAEVGVAHGGTSLLIALLNGGRKHWACDTFEGLVDVGEHDPQFTNHQFHNPREKVAAVMRDCANAELVGGYFPESALEGMREATYALAHIDVDTYASTKNCFGFFATRMARGGILVIDDAQGERGTVGAVKAFDEIQQQTPRHGEVVARDVPPQIVLRFR